MSIAGLMSPQKACKDVISVGGAEGFSTFYGYYMLQALAQSGEYQQALDIIRQFWGGMLDLGATTFWEDFNLDWAQNAGRLDEFVPEGKRISTETSEHTVIPDSGTVSVMVGHPDQPPG